VGNSPPPTALQRGISDSPFLVIILYAVCAVWSHSHVPSAPPWLLLLHSVGAPRCWRRLRAEAAGNAGEPDAGDSGGHGGPACALLVRLTPRRASASRSASSRSAGRARHAPCSQPRLLAGHCQASWSRPEQSALPGSPLVVSEKCEPLFIAWACACWWCAQGYCGHLHCAGSAGGWAPGRL